MRIGRQGRAAGYERGYYDKPLSKERDDDDGKRDGDN
jgi:hypothetical protein